MRIRFTADALFETEGRKLGTQYREGEIHELREDLAHRWIRRDVAVEVATDDPAPAEAEPSEAQPAADAGAPEQAAADKPDKPAAKRR